MSDISVQNSGTDDFYDPVSLSAGNWDLIKQIKPPQKNKSEEEYWQKDKCEIEILDSTWIWMSYRSC